MPALKRLNRAYVLISTCNRMPERDSIPLAFQQYLPVCPLLPLYLTEHYSRCQSPAMLLLPLILVER